MKITRKRRHEAMLDLGMHSGNTDAKFDPPPEPKAVKLKSKDGCAECEVPEKYVAALIASGKWVRESPPRSREAPMTEADVLEAIGGWRIGCECAVEHGQMVGLLEHEGFLCIRRHFAPATPDGDPAYELTTMGLKRLALIGTDEQFKDAVNKRDWYRKNASTPFPVSPLTRPSRGGAAS